MQSNQLKMNTILCEPAIQVFVNSSNYNGDSTTWSVLMNRTQLQRNTGNNAIFAASMGKTEIAYFKLEIDTEAPRWSNNATTPTSPATYNSTKNYQFNVTWTDNTYLSNVTIEHNFTGTLQKKD